MNPDNRLGEADFILAEVDNLIASTEKRIERQQNTVRLQAGGPEAGNATSAELETMKAALEKLKTYRARITSEPDKEGPQ